MSQTKADRSTRYNAGANFDSFLSKPCERKTLVMAEKSQKPLLYFFTQRKQCEDESNKESTTMQVAHEDLNDVDDPTKEIATKAKRKFQPRWLKSYPWLDYDQVNNSKEVQFMRLCLANIRISCDDFSLL